MTLGDLEDALKNLDIYGLYLRGFEAKTGDVTDEPEAGLETVLTIKLTIEGDLEPQWTLISERATAQNQTRNLNWADRVRLAPTRLGAVAAHNLSWRRGSILNKVSEERVDASAALVKAARHARSVFGEVAKDQLGETLRIVEDTANDLGIPIGDEVKAMLDAHSISFAGGTISLHDDNGVPLRGLGIGSTRLLIAGLQRCAAQQSSIILIDELEHGLEPHRIIRLLDALGAKEKIPPLQVFMTTHSPVVVRELSGDQLYVVRCEEDKHEATVIGTADDVQGTIRRHPEALLAPSVIVCEGASEVGLVRGLEQYLTSQGSRSIAACGVAIVDGGGSSIFARATTFQSLGYRTAVVRDSDVQLATGLEATFKSSGGFVVAWRPGRALEDELFMSLTDDGVDELIAQAIEFREESLVDDHIKSASNNAKDLNAIQEESLIGGISLESRAILGKAARSGKGWFKNVGAMQAVARDVIGPDLPHADEEFRAIIYQLFDWAADVAKRR